MIYGDRVQQGREAGALTQAELGKLAGVSQAAVARIEANDLEPSEELLDRIAFATKFPPAFFRQPYEEEIVFSSLLYRSRVKVSAKSRLQAFRYLQLYAEAAARMAEGLKTPPIRLPRLNEDPVAAARFTRELLGVAPDQPITNLVRRLERIGVLVLNVPLEVDGLDGFSAWPANPDAPPIIGLTETSAGDRQRFSLAHEVGELVTNHQPRGKIRDMEGRANAFAAELLLPEVAITAELAPPVTLLSVAELKPKWGVSLQSLLLRARELRLITERQYRYLQTQLSARGWRMCEPDNLRVYPEQPRAFLKMAELLFGRPPDLTRLSQLTSHGDAFTLELYEAQAGRTRSSDQESRVVPFRNRNAS